KQALISSDAFDEHGARQHRDPTAGNSQRPVDEFLAQAEGRVSNDPIKRLRSVLGFQEIGNSTKAIVEDVKGHDLAKIMSKRYRHVPATARRLKTCHRTEGALGDDDMLYKSPRRPRRRGKVIEAVF